MVYILEIIKELFKEIENSFTVRCQIVKPFFPCWRYNQLPQVITLNFEIIHFYQKLFTETSKLINFTRIFKIHPKFLHEFFYTNCFTRTDLHKLIYTNCLISPKFTFICQHLPQNSKCFTSQKSMKCFRSWKYLRKQKIVLQLCVKF